VVEAAIPQNDWSGKDHVENAWFAGGYRERKEREETGHSEIECYRPQFESPKLSDQKSVELNLTHRSKEHTAFSRHRASSGGSCAVQNFERGMAVWANCS
jgi:hypothetical protein